MNIKRILVCLFTAVFMMLGVAGCGKRGASVEVKGSSDEVGRKISIVTTIFPEYDWVMNILGENPAGAEVTMLLDNGVDLHSYQPTASDMIKISECDMFVYVGGESDEWVEDALKEAVNKDMVVVNLLEVLGDKVKAEEVVEGMQGEDEHDHDHEHEDGDDHEHEEGEEHEHDHEHEEGEEEMDEHVWLSLRNASVICDTLEANLEKIDGGNADAYKKNLQSYKEKLASLDEEYKKAVGEAGKDTVLFGDRFPFRYLVDDYALNYYAAFVGCSAESEASFETVTFLAGKVDELSLNAILTIENNNQKIAKTISENTKAGNQAILTMDSMQSTTAADVKAGASYLSIMESNLEVLKEALK
ncbi:MAG: zinc ABC transporter substrate-binding protein [Lachnospiraceae bacterium]|nr:zinc ABC transporter substrate-binding protein [Lachnospiraceae bacterium]